MAKLDPCLWLNDMEKTEFHEEFRPSIIQLVDYLRSDREIGPEFRKWLADLIDPYGRTQVRLIPSPRKRGRLPSTEVRRKRWEAAEFMEEQVAAGKTVEDATFDATEKFEIGSTILRREWAILKEVRRIQREEN